MIVSARIVFLQDCISRTGDQDAYKELFTAFYSGLSRFAKNFVQSREAAEEIVSDVFLSLWQGRKELPKINNLRVYLFIATRNKCLTYLQKQKRLLDTRDIEQFPMEFKSTYFNPEELMITSEMVSLIQKAIDNLPSKCQVIFKLVKDDGFKYKEVAEILNISTKTVENQLAIALRKISAAISFDINKTVSSSPGR